MSADVAYPGARPFGRDDSGKFFGRKAEAEALSAHWLGNPLTFLYGPAGIGKTSLLAAGVLPLVNRNNVELLPVGGFSRGSSSPVAPPGPHTPYTLALLRAWSAYSAVPRLAPFTVDEFVARQTEQRDPSILLLAAIDQAEELLAGPPSRQQQRQQFLRELEAALRHHPSLRLLICIRDGGALRHYTRILGAGVQIQLDGLEPERACEAVERPGHFDRRAARDLVEALRTSQLLDLSGTKRRVVADQVEPSLLQAACARLWELLRVRRAMITSNDLRQHGDVDAVLAAHCGAAIGAVADVHGVSAPSLLSWLMSAFVTPNGGRQDVPESQARSAGLAITVARGLEDRHLLRAHSAQSPGARIYRLISDRVIEPLRRPQANHPEGDPDAHLLAAERALTAGEPALAERHAQRARAAAPATDLVLHGSVYSLLGNVARQQSDLVQAERHYREALTLFEAAREHAMVAPLLAAIGRTLIDRGELFDGVKELYAAVQRMPGDAIIQTEFSAAAQELAWQVQNQPGPPRISPA